MKNLFKGYYNIEGNVLEQLWKDEKTLFVFDTNVLLNLYGYAKQTREDFFNILDAINDKLWIPYHVGLEYQRRRLGIIRNEKAVFNDIEANLEKIQKVFKGDFEKLALKRRFPKLFENTEKLEKEVYKSISNYKKSAQHWDSEQPCVRSHDSIRDKLNELFDEKVGERPESQQWLDDLYKSGTERYRKKIPPGFKDSGKANSDDDTHFFNDGLYYERQYGDLILWRQLISKAKSKSIENVIFITDDAKEDWWYKINSNGKKTIGPLSELQSEIYRESNIKNFHMYSTSMFLEDGKSNLAVDVSESSIEDASTSHIIENRGRLTPKQMSAIADPYSLSAIDPDRLRRIAERTNKMSSWDNEKYRDVFERASKISAIDNERLRGITETANRMNTLDNEKFKEVLEQANKNFLLESERVREFFKSQERIQKESENYETLTDLQKWYLKNKDKDEES